MEQNMCLHLQNCTFKIIPYWHLLVSSDIPEPRVFSNSYLYINLHFYNGVTIDKNPEAERMQNVRLLTGVQYEEHIMIV